MHFRSYIAFPALASPACACASRDWKGVPATPRSRTTRRVQMRGADERRPRRMPHTPQGGARRQRSRWALLVEVVAVAVHAVADVDLAALGHVLLELRPVLAQRVFHPGDVDLLAPELDGPRRRRMDGAQLGRSLRLGRGLAVGVVAEQDR